MQKSNLSTPGEIHWSLRPYVKVSQAAELLAVSRGMIYRLNRAGHLRFVSVGQRTLVNVESLTRYITSIETEAADREAQAVRA